MTGNLVRKEVPVVEQIQQSFVTLRFLFGGFPAVVEYNTTSQNFLTR